MNTKTNVDAYAGKRSKLLKAIGADENYGEIKFNGVVWQAMSETGEEIEAGAEVEVIRVEGNKMVVKLSKPANTAVEKTEQKESVVRVEVPECAVESKEPAEKDKTTKKTKKVQDENN